ncbi:MAG: HutD family protein [Alphaproteobacteria bacterium]|nr:HutD family protein [Alphaproteobacteria bacterium]
MAGRIRHVAASRYKTVPWRNGGGMTAEIAIEPEGAAVDSKFLWRISLARIDRGGPFSPFDGYDRTIALVSGAGMVLNFRERGSARIDKPLQLLAFSGEWAPGCALVEGPTEDLNVMTDRARVRHQVQLIEPSTAGRTAKVAPTLAIFAPAGGRATIDGETVQIGERDTVIADGAAQVTFASGGAALAIGLFTI